MNWTASVTKLLTRPSIKGFCPWRDWVTSFSEVGWDFVNWAGFIMSTSSTPTLYWKIRWISKPISQVNCSGLKIKSSGMLTTKTERAHWYRRVRITVVCIYQPLCTGRMWHKVNFYVEFNRFEFRVFLLLNGCLTKEKEPSLPYYLPIAEGRITGFMPFPRLLVLCEIQSALSRIWTRDVESIFFDYNHYTTGT